jgi:hypothetical protein
VRLVIADTSPINYLLLIGYIDILPMLFEKVILPAMVRDELSHPKAPPAVRNWIATPPVWVDVFPTSSGHDPAWKISMPEKRRRSCWLFRFMLIYS